MAAALEIITDRYLFAHMQSLIDGQAYYICQFQKLYECKTLGEVLEKALEIKNWKIVNWIQKNKANQYQLSEWEGRGISDQYPAPAYANLETAKWLHQNLDKQFKYWDWYMDVAACRGDFTILQFLHTHRTEQCTKNAMNWAATHGHLDIVKFLHSYRKEGCSEWAMSLAAMNNHLSIVEFLHYNRTEGCSEWALEMAACRGHFNIVKFLTQHRNEGSRVKAYKNAEEYEHPEIAKYLAEITNTGLNPILGM